MVVACLWQLSDEERYTLAELKTDLSGCKARHVHVIADQSYSGEIARTFKRSRSHRNVVVYTSSKDTEYSFGNNFTSHWTRVNHTRLCTKDVFNVSWLPVLVS